LAASFFSSLLDRTHGKISPAIALAGVTHVGRPFRKRHHVVSPLDVQKLFQFLGGGSLSDGLLKACAVFLQQCFICHRGRESNQKRKNR
jgi:hypothetical protein